MPLRWLLEPIAGSALPERDAVTGTSSNLLDVPGPVGEVVTPISWEIFFPDRTREGVERGARLVLNPTNGSSFTGTIVQTQQVAASRMRAIESGRWVGQVAPTGFTALIDDEGNVVERSAISEQAVIQGEVRLREGLTIYTRLGNLPGLALATALIAAGWAIQRHPRLIRMRWGSGHRGEPERERRGGRGAGRERHLAAGVRRPPGQRRVVAEQVDRRRPARA